MFSKNGNNTSNMGFAKEADVCSCVRPSAKARLVIGVLVTANSRIKVIEEKILQIMIQEINQATSLITNTNSPC